MREARPLPIIVMWACGEILRTEGLLVVAEMSGASTATAGVSPSAKAEDAAMLAIEEARAKLYL